MTAKRKKVLTAPVTYGDAANIVDLVPIPHGVTRAVAGNGGVPREVLRKVLGRSWFVYHVLMRERDEAGRATLSGVQLQRMLPGVSPTAKPLTRWAFNKYLAVLRKYGLVESVQNPRGKVVDPATGRKTSQFRHYYMTVWGLASRQATTWRVFGACGAGASEMYAVPHAAEVLIMAASKKPRKPGSGGRRPGAGRPKGVKNGHGKNRPGAYREQRRMMSTDALIAETEALFGRNEGVPTIKNRNRSEGTDSKNVQRILGAGSLTLSHLLYPPHPAFSLSSREKKGAPKAELSPPPSGGRPSAGRDETGDPTDGPRWEPVAPPPEWATTPVSGVMALPGGGPDETLLGRNVGATHSPLLQRPHELLPNYVSVASTAGLRLATPAPPRLDPRETPERHAFLLMKWFEGAVRSRFGKELGVFKRTRGNVTKSTHFGLLVEAAKAFIAEDIPPAAWCAFSCQVWEQWQGGKGLPPVKFMFSPKRIQERAGWFRSEAESFTGGRVLYTATMREFIARQQAARWVPLYVRNTEQLRAHVERFFPGETRAKMLAHIREETKALGEELASLLSVGEWLW